MAVAAAGDISLCGFVSRLIDETFVFDSAAIPWEPDELGFSYANPSCAVDSTGAVLVADGQARKSALYVAEYAP